MIKDTTEYQDYVTILFPQLREEDDKTVAVKTFTFQVTEDCSLRCSYCYQHEKRPNKMTFDVAKQAIDYLFAHKDDEDFYFSTRTTSGIVLEFIGGEPLLEIKLIRQICDYFEDRLIQEPDCPWLYHHKYAFSTNGVAYFNDDVQDFLNVYGNFTSMSITIDGCKELHDSCRLFPDGSPSYDICIKAALDQLKRGNDATKITLSPENIKYVFDGVKNMFSIGFTHLHMNSVYEDVWKPEDATKLYEQLKLVADWLKENDLNDEVYFGLFDPTKYEPTKDEQLEKNWCGSVGNMLAVNYKGEIFPCLRFMESALGSGVKPYTLGTLENGIGATEEERDRIVKLNTLTRLEQSEDKCLTCPIESGCSWCSAYNYQCFGTIAKRATHTCYNHLAGALGAMYYYRIIGDKDTFDRIKPTKGMALKLISSEEWEMLTGGWN